MHFLITGASGYIGAHVGTLLMEHGHKVTGLDDFSAGSLRPNLPYKVHEVDLRQYAEVAKIFSVRDIDVVIHLAGKKQARESINIPDRYWSVNVGGTRNILKAMKASRIELLVFSSSCAVYGSKKDVIETSPFSPESPYGETKVAAEDLLRMHNQQGSFSHVSLRFFNVIGCHPNAGFVDHNPESIINRYTEALEQDLPLPVYGDRFDTPDGTAIRDYIDVRDVAAAHLDATNALIQGRFLGGAINLCSGNPRSVLEIASHVNRIAERKSGNVHILDSRPGDPAEVWGTAQLAERVLNWSPKYDIEDSIQSQMMARRNPR